MMIKAVTRGVALSIALLCFSWSLTYVIFGNTPGGHDWYGAVSSQIFDDAKAGVPVLTLALPLLISSSACALLLLAPPAASEQQKSYAYAPRSRTLALPRTAYRWLRRRITSGDANLGALSFVFVLLPCACFVGSSIYRHQYGKDVSTSKTLKNVGNAFGLTAAVSLSFFLVPVARHSPLLTLAGWTEGKAVRLHIWSGRIGIVGVALHGFFHTYRWFLDEEDILGSIIPKVNCFMDQTADGCSSTLRNFTGYAGLVAFLIIGGTSVGYVRRKFYRFFYAVHVISGPIALLFTVVHWNRMILFLCPSILYYAACSFPVMVQSLRSYFNDGGVKIASVSDLSSTISDALDATRQCISFTFMVDEQATGQYRPGQYVKVKVPAISNLSHPFTVNKVPNRRNEMRIIFRATGPFTRALALELVKDKSDGISDARRPLVPAVLMDGFYGPQRRIQQLLQHDAVVVVAGGVGITPYLSMLTELRPLLLGRGKLDQTVGGALDGLKHLTLHWICRDTNLIAHVSEEYLSHLTQDAVSDEEQLIRIVIHDTSSSTASAPDEIALNGSMGADECVSSIVAQQVDSMGVPFSASDFSVGTKERLVFNLPYFFTFSTISWLGLSAIWAIYNNVQSKENIMSRSYGLFALLAIALVVSIVATFILDRIDMENALSRWVQFRKHAYTGLMGSTQESRSNDAMHPDEFAPEDGDTERGLSMSNLNSKSVVPIESNHLVGPAASLTSSKLEKSRRALQDFSPAVSLEHSVGRPHSVADLLRSLDAARNPAVFCCGPEGMMKDVKRASRCSTHCLNASTPSIYAEEFSF